MLIRTLIAGVVLLSVLMAGCGATAQEDLSSIEAKIKALKDPNPAVQQEAARSLSIIRPATATAPAVLALTEALNDPNVQQEAANALVKIGPAAAPAVPALIEALKDRDRRSAAFALSIIGPAAAPAVPALIEALKDRDPNARYEVALALRNIGSAATPAVPALIEVLKDVSESVRQAAAAALGNIGAAAEPALPALTEALKDRGVGTAAADALGVIATSLQDGHATGSLGALQKALDALNADADPEVRKHAAQVRRAVEYLELRSWETYKKDAIGWIGAHPYLAAVVGAVPIWLAFCLGLFCFAPAAILTINDFLRPFEFKLPDTLGGIKVPLRHLLLIGALNHRPRVLDAWVSRHVGKARENFERKRTVGERSVHISLPVYLDSTTVPELAGRHLRDVFGTGTGRLLLWGEGGAGKTSIACRIARWAMADVPEERPAPHRMLPVLIERELDFDVQEKRDPFTETVRGDLAALVEAPVTDDLVAALLKRRRVLVIVDHLSEMTEATRQRVRPDVPGFPAAALLVTSRLEERLGDVPKSALQPLRVTGDYLFEFMGAYLRARGVRDLFPDREFGQAGAHIADLVGERDVTVLLVKLYLDRLIATKEQGGDIDEAMPGSIPSLMLRFLNDINRSVPEDARRDEREVHRDAETVAWACLNERFRPEPARIDEVVTPALTAVDPERVRERLVYLERRLRLIETVEPERDRVRFLLDPVAEYLAGLDFVKSYRADADQWREFLARADGMPGGLEAVRGFLLAARDCCLASEGKLGIPEFVPDELAKRAGLDLERLQLARLRERIARYSGQLKASDPDDRRIAADALKYLGQAAEPALPALIDALSHLNTAAASVVVELAKEELRCREEAARSGDARKAHRVSWFSLAVSVLALVVAGLSLAWTVTRSPRPKDEVPTVSSQPVPAPQAAPQKLLPGTKFQKQQ